MFRQIFLFLTPPYLAFQSNPHLQFLRRSGVRGTALLASGWHLVFSLFWSTASAVTYPLSSFQNPVDIPCPLLSPFLSSVLVGLYLLKFVFSLFCRWDFKRKWRYTCLIHRGNQDGYCIFHSANSITGDSGLPYTLLTLGIIICLKFW